jgi:hypothetical protein
MWDFVQADYIGYTYFLLPAYQNTHVWDLTHVHCIG